MRKLLVVPFILALVAGGWSAAWFYVAHEANVQFDAWLKSEDAQGRAWTCPDRIIDGYPFALSVHCTKPTYAAQALDQTVTASAAGLAATVTIAAPRHLDVTLLAPLSYRTSDGQAELTANWSRLVVAMDGLPTAGTVTLQGTNLVVDGSFGETGRQGGGAATLAVTLAAAQAADSPALAFTIALRGAAIPSIDALLGDKAPVDIDLAGRLDHAEAGDARTPEEAVESWRQAGGRVDLASSRVSRGPSSVSGTGAIGLDGDHRLQGRLEANFIGLEPVLKRYGISGNLAAASNILNALFGGGPPQPAAIAPGAVNLPINFENGRLGVGPIQTPVVLPPLY